MRCKSVCVHKSVCVFLQPPAFIELNTGGRCLLATFSQARVLATCLFAAQLVLHMPRLVGRSHLRLHCAGCRVLAGRAK